MPAPTLSIPDLSGQFARLVPDGQLRLRSMFVGVFVAAAAFDLLIFVRLNVFQPSRAFVSWPLRNKRTACQQQLAIRRKRQSKYSLTPDPLDYLKRIRFQKQRDPPSPPTPSSLPGSGENTSLGEPLCSWDLRRRLASVFAFALHVPDDDGSVIRACGRATHQVNNASSSQPQVRPEEPRRTGELRGSQSSTSYILTRSRSSRVIAITLPSGENAIGHGRISSASCMCIVAVIFFEATSTICTPCPAETAN